MRLLGQLAMVLFENQIGDPLAPYFLKKYPLAATSGKGVKNEKSVC
ncbi:MAG TPA: hypothetical protein H9829_07560 [Candidatus Tetragenococcus pullicola]|nr:hypothetical protein [Candidatus Tetragenococcus pullicola]